MSTQKPSHPKPNTDTSKSEIKVFPEYLLDYESAHTQRKKKPIKSSKTRTTVTEQCLYSHFLLFYFTDVFDFNF